MSKDRLGIIICLLLLSGCAGQQNATEACRNKISVTLLSFLERESYSHGSIEITALLNDTSGLRASFPKLSIPNPSVALGHLTKEEILRLCNEPAIRFIDLPKQRYPIAPNQ